MRFILRLYPKKKVATKAAAKAAAADGGDALISALHAPSGAPGQTLLEVWRAAKVLGHQLTRPEQQKGGDMQPLEAKQWGGDNVPVEARLRGLQAQAEARGLKPGGGEQCPGCPGEACSVVRLAGGRGGGRRQEGGHSLRSGGTA